jgi:hypothetical protein
MNTTTRLSFRLSWVFGLFSESCACRDNRCFSPHNPKVVGSNPAASAKDFGIFRSARSTFGVTAKELNGLHQAALAALVECVVTTDLQMPT